MARLVKRITIPTNNRNFKSDKHKIAAKPRLSESHAALRTASLPRQGVELLSEAQPPDRHKSYTRPLPQINAEMRRSLIFLSCLILLTSCKTLTTHKLNYSSNDIKIDWFNQKYFLKRNRDILEITCPRDKSPKVIRAYEVQEGWIENMNISNKQLIISYDAIASESIMEILDFDNLCGIEIVLQESTR